MMLAVNDVPVSPNSFQSTIYWLAILVATWKMAVSVAPTDPFVEKESIRVTGTLTEEELGICELLELGIKLELEIWLELELGIMATPSRHRTEAPTNSLKLQFAKYVDSKIPPRHVPPPDS